jgi:hypothetical protein
MTKIRPLERLTRNKHSTLLTFLNYGRKKCVFCVGDAEEKVLNVDGKESLNASVFSGHEEMFAFDRTVSRCRI